MDMNAVNTTSACTGKLQSAFTYNDKLMNPPSLQGFSKEIIISPNSNTESSGGDVSRSRSDGMISTH